jgi:hypothetical protein
MKILKIKNLLVAFVLGLLLVQPAISQTAVSFGMFDCGQWVAKSNLNSRTWLAGYVSGLNSALATPKNDPLNKINSIEQIYLWMDNFCQKNPLKTVQDGGNALYFELQLKTR